MLVQPGGRRPASIILISLIYAPDSCSHRSLGAGRGGRSLRSIGWIAVESPQVFLSVGFEANLLFCTGTQGLGPNYAKFCFVLPIVECHHATDFELATNRAQPNSGAADVEGMDQFRKGVAGNVVAGDSYRQHRFGSVNTTLFTRGSCLLYQGCQSFIRRSQCHFLCLRSARFKSNERGSNFLLNYMHVQATAGFSP